MWDLSGKELQVLEDHQDSVWDLRFSLSGDRIATRGSDGTARLWDSSGKQLQVLEGHQGPVTEVLFSPSGDRLATLGEDGTARLWDMSGRQIAQYDAVRMAFNSDWSKIVTVQKPTPLKPNYTVTLWRVDNLDGLIARGCEYLHPYLSQSSRVSNEDRGLCGIPPRVEDSAELGEQG